MVNSYVGVDYLALSHKDFPTRRALRALRGIDNPCVGVLWNTFGADDANYRILGRYLRRKDSLIRIHLTNHVCVRKSLCATGECRKRWSVKQWNTNLENGDPRLERAIIRRVKKVKEVFEGVIGNKTELVLSVALEHQLSKPAQRMFMDIITDVWRHDIITNPVGDTGDLNRFDGLELHGTHPTFPNGLFKDQRYAALDGVEVRFPHRASTISESISEHESKQWVRRNSRDCKAVFIWRADHQGIIGGSFVKPRKRSIIFSNRDAEVFNRILKGA